MNIFEFIPTTKKRFLKLSLFKKILVILIVLVLGIGVQQLLFKRDANKIEYQTATVEKGMLITSVTASGTITSGSTASIVSSATGIVKEVYVKNGDVVSAGDKIAFIELDQNSKQQQTQAWANYLSAQNNVNSAKAKMNALQAALFEAHETFVNGAGTENPIVDDPTYIIQRANWLQAEADYKNQENVIRQAEASLSSAWLSYSQISSTVTAPISGIVSNLSISPGLTISDSGQTSSTSTSTTSDSSSSQALGTIMLENATPQAVVNLSEIDVTKVEVGQKVTLTMDAFSGKTFTGKVAAINTNGTSNSGVTSYPVTITYDTDLKNAYPNMGVSANIITSVKDNVLLIPLAAVQTTNGQSTVRVMEQGKVTSKEVETGNSNDTETEITSGLREGETIVTGQTGGATSRSSSSPQESSPFGSFGGRGFGGQGGQTIIQRR